MPALLKIDAAQKKQMRELFDEEISQVSGGLKGTTDPGPNPDCTFTIIVTPNGDGGTDSCDPET